MFDSLEKEDIFKIIDIELNDFFARVNSLGYHLTLSNEAREFIATKGYDKNFGARPLKRSIQKYLEDELAELMLSLNAEGKIGGTVVVTYLERMDKLTFAYQPADEVNVQPIQTELPKGDPNEEASAPNDSDGGIKESGDKENDVKE